jgi:hypothetical protein
VLRAGRVRTAVLLAASAIVPPLRASADVDRYSRSALTCPLVTVYEKVRVESSVFVGPEYDTTASLEPVSKVILGVPVTLTASEKSTSIEMISPATYVPFAVEEVTEETFGALVSITISLFPPREFAAAGAGRVRSAATIVPS